jgi:hypothetical protein
MKNNARLLASAVVITALLGVAACKKSSSYSSGGGAGNYAGVWNFTHTATSGTPAPNCDALNTPVTASVTVASYGSFTCGGGCTGTMNVATGVWSLSISDPNCGSGSGSGTCSSLTACSGTFSQPSTTSGTISWSR